MAARSRVRPAARNGMLRVPANNQSPISRQRRERRIPGGSKVFCHLSRPPHRLVINTLTSSAEESMNRRYIAYSFWAALSILLAAAIAQAQPAKDFQPEVGQAGKDVVWVPTPQALVDKMLDMAKVTPKDYVIDLGSGDGRTVITAAKRGSKALGIEYNPE